MGGLHLSSQLLKVELKLPRFFGIRLTHSCVVTCYVLSCMFVLWCTFVVVDLAQSLAHGNYLGKTC